MNAKATPKQYTLAEARTIGDKLGINWDVFTVKQYQTGLNAELADGAYNPMTGFPSDDPILLGKIVRTHLLEHHDYYTRWAQMERTAALNHAREQADMTISKHS